MIDLHILQKECNIKKMTEVNTFLGMEIDRNGKELKVAQTKMIKKLLKEFSMEETTNVTILIEVNFQVNEEEEIIDKVPYMQSYVPFINKPRKKTWEAAKIILHYLNSTKEYALQFKKGIMQVVIGVCDADWAGDRETQKSVSGFVCFHAENKHVTQSSMEAEYISAGIVAQELMNVKGTLSAFSDGMTFGWTSPMVPYLLSNSSHITTTERQAEWLENIPLLGSLTGLPLTIYLVDKIGRKKSLLSAAIFQLINWLAIGLGDRIEYIFVARFLSGIAANTSFVSAPMYVAEIADSKIRGFLSSIINIMMILGLVTVYCLGPFTPFYAIPIVGCILAGVQLLVLSFQPSSPYYLMYKNKPVEARKSLKRLKPAVADLEEELKNIADGIEKQKSERGRPKDLILVPSNRKAIIIMTVLNISQHMAGLTPIFMNLHEILSSAGSIYLDRNVTAIAFALIMLLATISGSGIVDRFGRKSILLISGFLSGVSLLTLSVYFHLQFAGYEVSPVSWIPVTSVLIYAFVFKSGLGLVPIVLTAEMFPSNVKAIGMTVADVMFVLGGLLSIYLYQMLHKYGMYVPFYLFTACAFVVSIYSFFYIPETKGRNLEEIQMILKGEIVSKWK